MPSAIDDVTLPQSVPNAPNSTNAQRVGSIDSAGRRKSSASGVSFSGLKDYQKKSLADPAEAARRQSFNDQRRETGWLGGLWNNWVRGPGNPQHPHPEHHSAWSSKDWKEHRAEGAMARSVNNAKD